MTSYSFCFYGWCTIGEFVGPSVRVSKYVVSQSVPNPSTWRSAKLHIDAWLPNTVLLLTQHVCTGCVFLRGVRLFVQAAETKFGNTHNLLDYFFACSLKLFDEKKKKKLPVSPSDGHWLANGARYDVLFNCPTSKPKQLRRSVGVGADSPHHSPDKGHAWRDTPRHQDGAWAELRGNEGGGEGGRKRMRTN